jgi:hypothetical protein
VFNAHIWSAILAATANAIVWLAILYWVQRTFLEYQGVVVKYVQFELPTLTRLLVTLGGWVGRHLVFCSLVIVVGISIDVVILYLLRIRQRRVLRQVWFGTEVLLPTCFVAVASWMMISPIASRLSLGSSRKNSRLRKNVWQVREKANHVDLHEISRFAKDKKLNWARNHPSPCQPGPTPRLWKTLWAKDLRGNKNGSRRGESPAGQLLAMDEAWPCRYSTRTRHKL